MLEKFPVIGSKAIDEIWFNHDDQTIIVVTKAGKKYTFYGQSRSVYQEFCASESKGKYFNQLLRSLR